MAGVVLCVLIVSRAGKRESMEGIVRVKGLGVWGGGGGSGILTKGENVRKQK